MSLNFVSKGSINYIPALVQIADPKYDFLILKIVSNTDNDVLVWVSVEKILYSAPCDLRAWIVKRFAINTLLPSDTYVYPWSCESLVYVKASYLFCTKLLT